MSQAETLLNNKLTTAFLQALAESKYDKLGELFSNPEEGAECIFKPSLESPAGAIAFKLTQTLASFFGGTDTINDHTNPSQSGPTSKAVASKTVLTPSYGSFNPLSRYPVIATEFERN